MSFITDIRNYSAAVIGCGGLGTNAAVHLVGMGIGRLILVDGDVVNKGNLNRQFLYTPDDVGRYKAKVLEKRLESYNPEIEITSITDFIYNSTDLNCCRSCDIVLLCVDNAQARKMVQQFCDEASIPLVNGGVDNTYGTVYLYIPGVTPCLSCAGQLSENNVSITGISACVGIIGSMQAELACRYLTHNTDNLIGRLLLYDTMKTEHLTVFPSSECTNCKNLKRR